MRNTKVCSKIPLRQKPLHTKNSQTIYIVNQVILWTYRIVFYICAVVCLKISFTGGSYRVGISRLICNASELAVFYM